MIEIWMNNHLVSDNNCIIVNSMMPAFFTKNVGDTKYNVYCTYIAAFGRFGTHYLILNLIALSIILY